MNTKLKKYSHRLNMAIMTISCAAGFAVGRFSAPDEFGLLLDQLEDIVDRCDAVMDCDEIMENLDCHGAERFAKDAADLRDELRALLKR